MSDSPISPVNISTPPFQCRICGASGPHTIFKAREMMFGTREEFDYFQCSKCQCLQICHIPSNIERFYPPSYYSLQPQSRQVPRGIVRAYLQRLRCGAALFQRGHKLNRALSLLVDYPDSLHLIGPTLQRAGIGDFEAAFLDVGCGATSWWLTALRDLGFRRLVGIDPFSADDTCIDGIHILKKSLGEMKGSFSLITFHHSLEHVADQRQTLEQAARLLGPHGVCLVRIPIVSSYAWRTYGINWVEMDPPRHFYLHSLESIRIVARQAGLELFTVVYDSLAFEFYGSEQYLRDIPLIDPKSYWHNPAGSVFTKQDMEAFDAMAAKVNAEGEGGRAGFYFRAMR